MVQWLGVGRYVWNNMLEMSINRYKVEKKFYFSSDMSGMLPKMKEWALFVADCPAQALQQKCQDLSTALSSTKGTKKGFPQFKARHRDTSGLRFPQNWYIEGNRINLPKLKGIKFKQHRTIEGKMSACSIKRDRCGAWWITILTKHDEPALVMSPTNSVGIDVGLKEFAVTSDHTIFKNPRFLRKSDPKLKLLQRRVSKKQKGSQNKEHARYLLARQHRKVARQRKDFITKTAHSIVKMHDLVAVEDLNIAGMKKNHCLAKSIGDVGWDGFFEQLSWQCRKQGKYFIKVDQFAPTSRACSACGAKQDMPLSVRTYECAHCGLKMDRDFNAAINIRNWAVNSTTRAGTAQINACGDMMDDVGLSAQEGGTFVPPVHGEM